MAERAAIPAFHNGRQLPAGELPWQRLSEVEPTTTAGAGAPLVPEKERPRRPCAGCGRQFKPTRKRWVLCANCYKRGASSFEP